MSFNPFKNITSSKDGQVGVWDEREQTFRYVDDDMLSTDYRFDSIEERLTILEARVERILQAITDTQ